MELTGGALRYNNRRGRKDFKQERNRKTCERRSSQKKGKTVEEKPETRPLSSDGGFITVRVSTQDRNQERTELDVVQRLTP